MSVTGIVAHSPALPARAAQVTLAVGFIAVGAATLSAVPAIVAPFGTIENVTGLGTWFRAATGLLEVLGGLLLCGRGASGIGAVLLGLVMVGAVLADVLVLGTAPTAPAVLLVPLAAIAYSQRAALARVGAVLERNL